MGERTCALEMTWMRKTSASRGRQSFRKARKMRFSPFWLKIRMPDSIVAFYRGSATGSGADDSEDEGMGEWAGVEEEAPCCAKQHGKAAFLLVGKKTNALLKAAPVVGRL